MGGSYVKLTSWLGRDLKTIFIFYSPGVYAPKPISKLEKLLVRLMPYKCSLSQNYNRYQIGKNFSVCSAL